MSNWERREINNLIPEKPEDYKKRFPKPFSSMIPADAGPDNKLATEAYVNSHSGGGGSITDAVKYTSQSLTDAQKAQARANIGAGTYDKPSSGIPASDLASGVIPDVSGKEDTSNKVTSLSAQSTDTEYPSAKAVVDYVDEHGGGGQSPVRLFPSAAALNAAIPSPNVGDYAYVGNGFPADIYICQTAGTWVDSGEDYDGDNVDLTNYATEEKVNQLSSDFDSQYNQGIEDLEIADPDGNIGMVLSKGHIRTKWFDSSLIFDPSKKSLKATAAAFNSGDSMTITNVPNVRNKYVLSFCAEVSDIGTLTLHYGGNNLYARGKVRIDGTNIYVTEWGGNAEETYPHSLTFSKYIVVVVKTTTTNNGHIIILTDGGAFERDIAWAGSQDNIIASVADDGAFTNAELVMAYYGFGERLWIYGDSWADMWPVQMERLGKDNYLLDGYSGRGSGGAVASFKLGLNFGRPDYLLWMMGMNDPESSSVFFTNWRKDFDYVVSKCEELGIQFIGCTIPDGTTRTHTQKNAYIKASGLRYIDLAAAVGCSEPNSTGYNGVMQNDQVHPTFPVGSMKVALYLLEEINNIIK